MQPIIFWRNNYILDLALKTRAGAGKSERIYFTEPFMYENAPAMLMINVQNIYIGVVYKINWQKYEQH